MSKTLVMRMGPLGETVADNLIRIREEQHLSIAALARRLDEVGRPIQSLGLRKIEARKRRVDVDDLAALAEALNVPLGALLDRKACDQHRTRCLKWLLAEAEWNAGIRPLKPPFGSTLINPLQGSGQ